MTINLLENGKDSDFKRQIVSDYIIIETEGVPKLSLEKLLYYSQVFAKIFTGNFLFDYKQKPSKMNSFIE